MTTLLGKNFLNENNLLGKSYIQNQSSNIQIKQLKDTILKNYLIPLFTKNWSCLNENLFFIDKINKKLNYYYNIYKLDELLLYIDLIKVLQLVVEKNRLLEENELYSSKTKNELVSMIFKTTTIKLLPEYELYDSIIGKPKKELKQKYNENIIINIKNLLLKENITYKKIKDFIENNYKI